MIISIEGNIGSGKSTLLNLLKEKYSDKVIFVDEPVSEWNEVKDSDKSVLELFYQDKKTYSFTFQVLAYITRLKKILDAIELDNEKTIICERSIFTDKYIFAKMLYQQKYISEIEWKTYNYWFDTFKEKTKLDTIIYVKTEPETCLGRIKERNRDGETNISIEYLKHCHDLHQEWLENNSLNVIVFDGNNELNKIDKDDYINQLNLTL